MVRFIATLGCSLAACSGQSSSDAGPADAVPCTASTEAPELDLLFVIESSTIDTAQLDVLLDGMGDFSVLADADGLIPDLHVGVITADLGAHAAVPGCDAFGQGDGGRLQGQRGGGAPANCPVPSEAFIRYELDSLGERVTNLSGPLAETFSCIAAVGADGCGFDQPLESLHRALGGTVAENSGFRRPEAYLAVVFWLEEDDCSAVDPTIYDPEADLGQLSLRCVLHDIWCGEPPAPLTETAGVYPDCIPRPEPAYLHPVSRYVDLLRTIQPDPARLALMAWAFAEPLVIAENASLPGELYESVACGDGSWSAVGAAIRLDAVMREFPLRASTTQCERYPANPSDFVRVLTAPIREMLYCR